MIAYDTMTHEQYINEVRILAVGRLNDSAHVELLMRTKLVYGRGSHGTRGITCYTAWAEHNHDDSDAPEQQKQGLVELVEISASGEESPIQLAGTVLHELAHVLAGFGAGHKREWKAWCKVLGLPGASAKGTAYDTTGDGKVWDDEMLIKVLALPTPSDGRPKSGGLLLRTGKSGCATGQKKQVSRLRLWECKCQPSPVKLRVASDDLKAMCMVCGEMFDTESDGAVPVDVTAVPIEGGAD